jgi:fructan beta-fructosidase
MNHPYRPHYHAAPQDGWMNDPNGLVYYAGEYHLFYQWCRAIGFEVNTMSWAHAVSSDLVHWKHLPLALEHDEKGAIFSGSAVIDSRNSSGLFGKDGGMVAIFTHHARNDAERQSIAYSSDRGRTWTKYAKNPVLGDDSKRDFRDPKVFWHEPTQRWIMIVGCAHQLFSSENLRDWKGLGPTKFSSECPDLFPVPIEGESGSKWLLSLGGREYCLGEFDGTAFKSESGPIEVDGGPDFYASQSWDGVANGRRIWIGWLNNWKYCRQVPEFGARGFMSVPRDLFLRRSADGALKLVQRPVPELAGLRGKETKLAAAALKNGQKLFSSDAFELEAAIPNPSGRCGFKVRSSASQETRIGYDAAAGCAFIDRERSGNPITAGRFQVPLKARNGKISLRIFVDSTSVEAFFNDGEAVISTLIYPDKETGTEWFSENGTAPEQAAWWPLA